MSDGQKPPQRRWRLAGTDPLPTAQEALNEPLAAFPDWILRVVCDRCGGERMLPEGRALPRQRDMPLWVLLARMRHEGCGGQPDSVELLTGIEGGSRPVRKIVLREG